MAANRILRSLSQLVGRLRGRVCASCSYRFGKDACVFYYDADQRRICAMCADEAVDSGAGVYPRTLTRLLSDRTCAVVRAERSGENGWILSWNGHRIHLHQAVVDQYEAEQIVDWALDQTAAES